MLKIGDKAFEMKETLDLTLDFLKQYMNEHQIVLTNHQGEVLGEDQIVQLLANGVTNFESKNIYELEIETLEETISYLNHAIKRVEEIIQGVERHVLFQSVTELMESLVDLRKLATYFSIENISEEQIQLIAGKIVAQMENENDGYLVDVLEFEILPLLGQLRDSLEKRMSLQ